MGFKVPVNKEHALRTCLLCRNLGVRTSLLSHPQCRALISEAPRPVVEGTGISEALGAARGNTGGHIATPTQTLPGPSCANLPGVS